MKASSAAASSCCCALALLLLLLTLCASAAPVGSDLPTSCCFTYTARKIPRNLVASYYKTNSRCSLPAIVFITRKRQQICANPAERWVQGHVKDPALSYAQQG